MSIAGLYHTHHPTRSCCSAVNATRKLRHLNYFRSHALGCVDVDGFGHRNVITAIGLLSEC